MPTRVFCHIYDQTASGGTATLQAVSHDVMDLEAETNGNRAGAWRAKFRLTDPVAYHCAPMPHRLAVTTGDGIPDSRLMNHYALFFAEVGTLTTSDVVYIGGGKATRYEINSREGSVIIGGPGPLSDLRRVVVLEETGMYQTEWVDMRVSGGDGDAAIDSGLERVNLTDESRTIEWIDGGPATNGDARISLTDADPTEVWIYVGWWDKFAGVKMTLPAGWTNNTGTSVIDWQYFKFDGEGGFQGWVDLSTTNVSGEGFTSSPAEWSWTPPEYWGKVTHANRERYWIRGHVRAGTGSTASTSGGANIGFTAGELLAWGPDEDHLDLIFTNHVATYFSNWSLDATYESGVAGGDRQVRLHGATVLEYLVEAAERYNEFFRMNPDVSDPSSLEVQWLGQTEIDSGILLTNVGNPERSAASGTTMQIVDMKMSVEFEDSAASLYVDGSGQSNVAGDFLRVTDSATYANITFDETTDSHMVEVAGGTSNYDGVGYMRFSDIGSESGNVTDITSNQLVRAAEEEMIRRNVPRQSLRIEVSDVTAQLRVGEWYRVMWYPDAYELGDRYLEGSSTPGPYIDGNYLCRQVVYRYDGTGGLSASLELENDFIFRRSRQYWIYQGLRELRQSQRLTQPADAMRLLRNFGHFERT